MTIPTEDHEQEVLARWLDSVGVLWMHPPNGHVFTSVGGRDRRRFAKLRRLRKLGLKPGVVDAIIFTPPPAPSLVKHEIAWRGAALELKRQRGPKGGTSHCAEFTSEEKWWLTNLHWNGWLVPLEDGVPVPLYGAEEAIEWLRTVGGYA